MSLKNVAELAARPPKVRISTVREKMEEYQALLAQKKELDAKIEAAKAELREIVVANGSKNEKGSFVYEVDGFKLSNERRVKVGLVGNAADLLRGWGVFDLVKKEVVDEDQIEHAFNAGKITKDQMQDLVEKKESFAFFLEKEDDGKTPREKRLKPNS